MQLPKPAKPPGNNELPILERRDPAEPQDLLLPHAKLGDLDTKHVSQLVSSKAQ